MSQLSPLASGDPIDPVPAPPSPHSSSTASPVLAEPSHARSRWSLRGWLLGVAIATVAGCGGGAATTGVGTSHGPPREIPVELTLRTTAGAVVEIGDQRGAPCLLFVVSTYDGVSQAAIRDVSTFARAHMDTVVLAIVAQPDAATFAALYEQTFEPPFTVVYEAGETIQRGTSDLGPFDAVPAFYMLDASGRIADHHVGWIPGGRLDEMYAEAVSHGGIVAAPATTEAPIDDDD